MTSEVAKDMRFVWSKNGKYVAVVRLQIKVQVGDMHKGATAQPVGQGFNLGDPVSWYCECSG